MFYSTIQAKAVYRVTRIAFTIGVMLGVLFTATASATTLTLATDETETFPYYMGNSVIRKTDPGISVEIITQAAKRHGMEVKFVRMPWKRALETMASNMVDGAFNASFKTNRLSLGQYPQHDGKVDSEKRLATIRHVIYKLKDGPGDWDGSQFIHAKLPIGVVHSYSIADDLQRMDVKLSTAPNPQANLNKLILKRVGMIVESEVKMDRMLAKSPDNYANVIKLDKPFKIKPTYLMLSHQFVEKQPELAQKLWQSIGEIGASDEMQARYRHYFSTY